MPPIKNKSAAPGFSCGRKVFRVAGITALAVTGSGCTHHNWNPDGSAQYDGKSALIITGIVAGALVVSVGAVEITGAVIDYYEKTPAIQIEKTDEVFFTADRNDSNTGHYVDDIPAFVPRGK